MHIPDGWLTLTVSLFCWIISLIALGISLYQLRDLDEEQLTSMGIVGAIIFAAQMVNFPLFVGSVTGHLLGSALATFIIGPFGAIIVISVVLFIQALVFADGGLIFALGANIFNMAVVGVIIAEGIRQLFANTVKSENGFFIGAFLAAFLGVVCASIFAGFELFFSNQLGDFSHFITVGFPLIVGWHILIGIGEGIITTGILLYLWKIEFPIKAFDVISDGGVVSE